MRVWILLMVISASLSAKAQFEKKEFQKLVFAHRGGLNYGPENTLKTILKGIDHGVKALEIDVRLTKDNQLVLFHDETISRVLKTDEDKLVEEMTFWELSQIPLRNTDDGLQYVSTLKEVLNSLYNKGLNNVLLEIDFKPGKKKAGIAIQELNKLIVPYVNEFGDAFYNAFFVSTFYPNVLKRFEKTNPKIKKAFAIINNPTQHKFYAFLARCMASHIVKKYNVNIIEPNICMVDSSFVKEWKEKNILINAYTANTVCEKEYLRQFKIAYTTDCVGIYCEREKNDGIGAPKAWCKDCEKEE